MARRGRKRLKSKIKTSDIDNQDERHTGPMIPSDLLGLIISRFALRDNIRASLVCKQWQDIGKAYRKKSMMLMFVPQFGDSYEFYDPSERNSYWLELPQLHNSVICYAGHGWLLLYRSCDHLLFFFNPYSHKLIYLPKIKLKVMQQVAFSAPPTSSTCVIFTVLAACPSSVVVRTCRVEATGWSTVKYACRVGFYYDIRVSHGVVVSNGVFYILDRYSRLGFYNSEKREWSVIRTFAVRNLEFYDSHDGFERFFAEYNGEIYILHTCTCHADAAIYKLHESKDGEVLKVNDFKGMTCFASRKCSYITDDLEGKMRNAIYFPKVRFYGRRCVSYSLEDGRYYPRNESYDWRSFDQSKSVWMESPKDFSIFL